MNKKTKIAKLKAELKKLESKKTISPVSRCKSWVKAKRKANFVSSSKSEYIKANGDSMEISVLKFDNGESYNVGTQRFWKVK